LPHQLLWVLVELISQSDPFILFFPWMDVIELRVGMQAPLLRCRSPEKGHRS